MKFLEPRATAWDSTRMAKAEKFASQMDRELLQSLRQHAEASGRSISTLLDEAVREYLERVHVRPAFRSAMDEVLDEHDELLQRLAR